jgi:dipeptidyl aminopeptidase/acylaminoacyl peptidase
MRGTILGALLLGGAVSSAVAQTRGVLPQDYYRMTFVSDVQVSPTGAYVAFTVTTVLEEKNKRHQEVWLQRLERGRPAGPPFRFTDPTEESAAPRWSPDATLLAFTSRRGDDRNATWFARVTAPGGEAYHIPGVMGAPVWSPDGAWIAYTRAPGEDETSERSRGAEGQREGWIAADALSHTLDAKRFDGRVITSMRYKRDGTLALLPDPSIRRKSQLFVVPAAGGEPKQLTTLPFDVGGGGGGGPGGGGGGVVWSPDGRRLYFGGNPEQDDEYNEENTQQLYVIGVEGGEPRAITTNPGSETGAAISPDGKLLAYVATADRGSQPEITVAPLGPDGGLAGAPQALTKDWDLIPEGPTWTADGKTLQWEAGIGGNAHLFAVAAAGGSVRQVTTGDRQLNAVSWSGDGRVMAYTMTDSRTPAEVFVAQADGRGETRVTSFNDAWLAEAVRMPAERLTWRVADGTEVEGWVVKPVGFEPGKRYPMVLKIHGGPYGAYGNTFFDTFHILSGAGMFVLYANPRGSTGYGHAYQWATRGAWGEVDSEDFLTGVDAALARYPEIDPTRLGVSGGSYGGYMTNWLTATTDRFAAAVTSRSIVNWEGWWGSSDAQGLTDYAFFGTPWEERDRYRRLSPISAVERVTAPTLIIEGENDYRTPMGEGEQWFMSLKKRQVPAELVRYPRSAHGLSRTGEPWLLVDRLERIRSWFVHWLLEVPAQGRAGSQE